MRTFTCMLRVLYVLLACGVEVELAFKAAVYEHVVISPDDPLKNYTRDEAFEWMLKNLDIYEEQVARAAKEVSIF